jgi:hypothetical protein
MDFLNFNKDEAMKYGNQSSATSGKIIGTIESSRMYQYNGNIELDINLKPIDGRREIKYIKLNLQGTDNNGNPKEGWGLAKFNMIRGLLNLTTEASLKLSKEVQKVFGNEQQVQVINGLIGKQIGLVLQRHNWGITEDGKYYRYNMEIIMPFDAKTDQTFAERENGQKAKKVDSICETLKDKTDEGIGSPSYGGNSEISNNSADSDVPSYFD